MASAICSLANYGHVLWLLGIAVWYVSWMKVYTSASSQRLSTWMFRYQIPMLLLFMLLSFGVLMIIVEMSECFHATTT